MHALSVRWSKVKCQTLQEVNYRWDSPSGTTLRIQFKPIVPHPTANHSELAICSPMNVLPHSILSDA